VMLDRFSPVLHLVQTIRDEAHRFAVTFHRHRRGKRLIPKKPPRARAKSPTGEARKPRKRTSSSRETRS
jgi:hypothetical protein